MKNRGVEDFRLDQILEDVTSVRELGIVARLGLLHFADYVKGADIRERRRNAELVGRGADSARNHKHHMLFETAEMPVDFAYHFCDGDFFVVRHIVISDRVDIDNIVEIFYPRKAHRRALASEQDMLLRDILGKSHGVLALDDLERSALEQVYCVLSVVGNVDCELRIDGIIVFSLDSA